MKKIKYLLMLLLGVVLSASVISCSKDDDELGSPDKGSQNTTDVAVTGAVLAKNYHAVELTGYVNMHLITTDYSNHKMGIELSTDNTFSKSDKSEQESLVGNKMTAQFVSLTPSTTYYYRTYVYVNSHYYYGDTENFTTDGFSNITTCKSVIPLFNNAIFSIDVDTLKLEWGKISSVYKERHDNRYVGVFVSSDKSELTEKNINEGRIETGTYERLSSIWKRPQAMNVYQLEPNKTYYYCTTTMVGKKCLIGDIKSFTTISPDGYMSTGNVENITSSSATINCSSKLANLVKDTDYYDDQRDILQVSYREKGDSYWQYKTMESYNNENVNEIKLSNYTITLEYLRSKTTYEYCARANISGSYIYGEIKTFTTK